MNGNTACEAITRRHVDKNITSDTPACGLTRGIRHPCLWIDSWYQTPVFRGIRHPNILKAFCHKALQNRNARARF